jgi:hypothetical protein
MPHASNAGMTYHVLPIIIMVLLPHDWQKMVGMAISVDITKLS